MTMGAAAPCTYVGPRQHNHRGSERSTGSASGPGSAAGVVVVVSSPSADTEYHDPRATVTRPGPRPTDRSSQMRSTPSSKPQPPAACCLRRWWGGGIISPSGPAAARCMPSLQAGCARPAPPTRTATAAEQDAARGGQGVKIITTSREIVLMPWLPSSNLVISLLGSMLRLWVHMHANEDYCKTHQ
jgi:hypothetical protein